MIAGEKITLRALELPDAPLFLKWENDPDAREHSGFYQPVSAFMTEQFILHASRPVEETGQLRLVVENRAGEAVGLVDIFEADWLQRRAAMGIFISPDYRNQGLATEALSLMARYALQILNLELLFADIRENHAPSLKAFQNAGFHSPVLLPSWQCDQGKRWNVIRLFYDKNQPA